MIVVDSSAWIANLRGLATPVVRRLRETVDTADDQILLGDIILLEVLQGARDDAHAARIQRALETYPIAPMLDADLAVQAARNYRRLRALGITIRKTADIIIGTFCIAGGHALLHDDRDFAAMEHHLGLSVIAP
ncbi:type II toxin-antitoxin system VapC family toxin [Rhodopila globiformis]|uniref:Ribonuclease VapC n=1 Tax=Rhodopila globiformis TaxID=1071 RepID=A0A2S6NPF0_RHOGL|nr:PIN domain nuclease [Rhodopila globiformis]PPQ40171.1 VapC toxin family PIN domain ribonuclease [Rhodopila globiformis]